MKKLTPQQEARLAPIRDAALKFALGGDDSFNVEQFHEGIDFIYSLAKIDAPIKIWVDSPLGVQYAATMLPKLPIKTNQVGNQVRDQVWDQVRDQVGDQVKVQVADQVRDQVGDQVKVQVRAQVAGQVADQVRDQVGDQVKVQVRDQVWNQVWDQGMTYQTPALIGVGYDSGWVSFYKVFTEFGILKHDPFNQYTKFLESGVWDTVLFQGAAIGCRRPNFVARDNENRLHNDNRSAISWRDGFELFYLDGVHLTKELWQQITSQQMSFDEIVKIDDADVRAVALKYNKNAIIDSGAELIDEHPTAGELFLIKGRKINKLLGEKDLYFLRMKCPTGRTFVECVEPGFAKEHPYALHCQANAWGISADIYGQVVNHG